jgi:hypothetical protein
MPLEDGQKTFWEVANYVFALLGLFGVYMVYRGMRRQAVDPYNKLVSAHVSA